MDATNMANTYKQQQIMTASPAELTFLLYNGAVRFVNESIKALEQGNIAESRVVNLRAQDIVRELRYTLDMRMEISKNWARLYEFIEYNLIQGGIKTELIYLEQARQLLVEMRDTWRDAMKLAARQSAAEMPEAAGR